MTQRLDEIAETLERAANNALKSADWLWGWRRRDRKVSIAFGQLSRDLRSIALRLKETNDGR